MSVQTLLDYGAPMVSREAGRIRLHGTAPDVPEAAAQAVDLHSHSRHAANVSPEMTFENIVPCAWRKGIDVLATGDCLQPEWQHAIATQLVEDGSGLLTPHPELAGACAEELPPRFRRPLRFVLSTEVSCVPEGMPYSRGIHHLIYFRSLDSVRWFQTKVTRFGNLDRGRPALRMTSRELLARVLDHGDGAALAPAHVLGPNFSALGAQNAHRNVEEVFGDLAPELLGAEIGITSTPAMCRRISSLDRHSVFCCSDAHSLGKLGREYTLLPPFSSYDELMAALRSPPPPGVCRLVKFPAKASGGYFNGCETCRRVCSTSTCPHCGASATIGSHDRVEIIADRTEQEGWAEAPVFRELFPLAHYLAALLGVKGVTADVRRHHWRLLRELGHERHILTEAPEDEIAQAGTRLLARAILAQRNLASCVPPIF